jgi:WD40 repeat protein
MRLRPSANFSPDSRTVVTASSKTVRLWEVATGKEIAVLRGYQGWDTGAVSSVAFSPDGRMLITGSRGLVDGSRDSTARLWDVTSGTEVAVLRGHEDRINSVAFSPDGRTVVTGSQDKTVRLWDLTTGKETAVLRGHEDAVTSVAFGPDGRTVITGSDDRTGRLWEVATGKELARLPHDQAVTSVAFSPDGRMAATGSQDTNARLWEVATGREIARIPHQRAVSSVQFSPDGRTLIAGIDGSAPDSEGGTARLWPVGQGLIDLACARVHDLPLSDENKQRSGIEQEWCTPEISGALRAKLGLDQPETSATLGSAAR